jgi:hypothetical protein
VSGVHAILPPKATWDQGDIASGVYFAAFDAKRPGVLVTPACDLALDKVDLWTFVALYRDTDVARDVIEPVLDGWGSFQLSEGGRHMGLSAKQREQVEKKILDLLNQRYLRYHWLPVVIDDHPAHVADFSCVTSLPADEVRSRTTRIASLSSSWREQVPARYTAFMGRVGTVDYSVDWLDNHMKRIVGTLLAPPT